MTRYALVGCGSSKIVTAAPVEARNLYTSGYFAQKRTFAEQHCKRWWVVSAKHGAIPPDTTVQTYDCRIEDVDEEVWARRVRLALRACDLKWIGDDADLFVLLGQRYIEPIREVLGELDRHEQLGVSVRYPFADTAGIGEQRALLADLIDDSPGGPSRSGPGQDGAEQAEGKQATLGEVTERGE